MNKPIILITFALLLTLAKVVHGSNAQLIISDAWIAEAPPVSKVMVAYLSFKNTSDKTREIISAESATYSSIEFHETLYEDGMARMIGHDTLLVAAKSERLLKRGGLHLMLFNPVKTLKAGDEVDITFTMKDQSTQCVTLLVKKSSH